MLSRRQRLRVELEAGAAMGDVLAKTRLAQFKASQAYRRAMRVLHQRAAARWVHELCRLPLVPEATPEDAILIELPRLRDAQPRRTGWGG